MATTRSFAALLGMAQRRRSSIVVLALFWLALISASATAWADDVVVGVHSGAWNNTRVSRSTLQALFGMRLHTWPDGTAVKVFVLPDNHPLHIAFCKQVLHVFPHEMRSAWDRLVFSGTGQAPTEVESEEALRAKLAQTPGAIGYLTKPATDGGITVLSIE